MMKRFFFFNTNTIIRTVENVILVFEWSKEPSVFKLIFILDSEWTKEARLLTKMIIFLFFLSEHIFLLV